MIWRNRRPRRTVLFVGFKISRLFLGSLDTSKRVWMEGAASAPVDGIMPALRTNAGSDKGGERRAWTSTPPPSSSSPARCGSEFGLGQSSCAQPDGVEVGGEATRYL
jgi:hypothetical protein